MAESLSLASAPESPGEARRFVTGWLRSWGYPDLVEAAALVMSELATNTVRHTGQPFVVAVEDSGHGVHLSVQDPVHSPPVLRAAAPLDVDGRGLQIVAALADQWGTTLIPGDGKIVWCELDERMSSTG